MLNLLNSTSNSYGHFISSCCFIFTHMYYSNNNIFLPTLNTEPGVLIIHMTMLTDAPYGLIDSERERDAHREGEGYRDG